MRLHGRILQRTKYDPNTFIDNGDHVVIILYAENGDETGRALVDKNDLPLVQNRKWHVASRKKTLLYAEADHDLLHILILGRKDGEEIDHINGNGLDCRRSNLRHVSHYANILNRHTKIAKSGRMGVFWRPSRAKWIAFDGSEGNKRTRSFSTFEEAVAERERMEMLH